MRKRSVLLLLQLLLSWVAMAQTPAAWSSSEILLHMKKLKVLGSVLYIAAHPDDENTRLLAYLAKERQYRTGYLSLTRGDGGQNLIGDEQGIELGLIRTQELLAARRIDGAEQFFSRAYDFGFSKSTDEALRIWDKEKILHDVVWVIRRFQPDIIITRFPPDSRAGHGHHSASAVLAQEAFLAAANPKRFSEQFQYGVGPWQARRIIWNGFNFGGVNTTSEDQMKLDVGAYNPLLGKSYGEIASESRSQHKSQGFGVPRQRGQQWEYFTHVNGKEARTDIMDDVVTDWSRLEGAAYLNKEVDELVANFRIAEPAASVPALLQLYKKVRGLPNGYWKQQKLQEIQQLIEACCGLWLEASTGQEYVVSGDSLRVTVTAVNRSRIPVTLQRIQIDTCVQSGVTETQRINSNCFDTLVQWQLDYNRLNTLGASLLVQRKGVSDPYWLQQPMSTGSFNVADPTLIGKAENDAPYVATFTVALNDEILQLVKPVRYKYTDPVKDELYQPLSVYPPVSVKPNQSVMVFTDTVAKPLLLQFNGHATLWKGAAQTQLKGNWLARPEATALQLKKQETFNWQFQVRPLQRKEESGFYLQPHFVNGNTPQAAVRIRKIEYDHIPTITYFPDAVSKLVYVQVKTAGRRIGYITGAGDFVPYCLQQMGYTVDLLKPDDLTVENLRKYDAVVTGIRAYNIHEWLSGAHAALMQYVQDGGVLLVQYNTSSQIGPVRAKIGPYPFVISRNRVTEEDAEVTLLAPNHPLLNYPNKITADDFKGWVQERSIYEADQLDAAFTPLLGMNDAGEPQRKGSLVVANYGKGRFIYTGLVFFRQLPAGVPGAYRLMANLLAPPQP
ncbi:MAG: PIG-L family deacetylase [Lacibacter sp.]